MYRLIAIILLSLIASSSQAYNYEIPSFYITSICIDNTAVEKSNKNDGWILTLNFSSEGAAKIYKFSKENNGKMVKFIFKSDDYEFKTKTMLRNEITNQMRIEGNISNKEIFKVQDIIPTIQGECGVKKLDERYMTP